MYRFLVIFAGYIIPFRLYLYLSRKKPSIIRFFSTLGIIGKNAGDTINETSHEQDKYTRTGRYWSEQSKSTERREQSNSFLAETRARHINKLSGNVDSPIPYEGMNQMLVKQLCGRRLKHGVSVGCGEGKYEMRLLQLGVVDKLLLFECGTKDV